MVRPWQKMMNYGVRHLLRFSLAYILIVQELRDRKKIRYLLSMHGQAVHGEDENETTYFKDRLERRFVRSTKESTDNQVSCSRSIFN